MTHGLLEKYTTLMGRQKMLEAVDVISICEVASLLKKSVSWCYTNAAHLGAAKIAGSLIFRRSSLADALERGLINSRVQAESKQDPLATLKVKRSKRSRRPEALPQTDPSRYGLDNMLFRFSAHARHTMILEDIFADIDLRRAIEALRQ